MTFALYVIIYFIDYCIANRNDTLDVLDVDIKNVCDNWCRNNLRIFENKVLVNEKSYVKWVKQLINPFFPYFKVIYVISRHLAEMQISSS